MTGRAVATLNIIYYESMMRQRSDRTRFFAGTVDRILFGHAEARVEASFRAARLSPRHSRSRPLVD